MGEECGTEGRKNECVTGFGGDSCRQWAAWKKYGLGTAKIEMGVNIVKVYWHDFILGLFNRFRAM